MQPTDISRPDYFLKVVDCQWACPAHTPVPDYIRLIAEGRYADAYMINWNTNVFPGILGRSCDRPCEPACRRGRVEKDAVAICRLKRAAADYKGDISARLPKPPPQENGRCIALVGAGPASLTAARDLALLGYRCVIFDQDAQAGGMMRTRIPHLRVPETVINEEVNTILGLGIKFRGGERINSMKALLADGWDAIFVGSGAPRGKDLGIPGRKQALAHIHIGMDWLQGVSFDHIRRTAKRVVVIGGGNTAMDCGRTARRLGGGTVTVAVRSGIEAMKASAWEREDAMREGVHIRDCLAPKEFTHENGRLTGVLFEKVKATQDEIGRRLLIPSGEPDEHIPCDEVLIAIGQENAFPWIERDMGIEFGKWDLPRLDPATLRSTHPKVFFGGDCAFGPKNIISAVAHGHEAAISIDRMCHGEAISKRTPPSFRLSREEIGGHWHSCGTHIDLHRRYAVPLRDERLALADVEAEAELGFDPALALAEAHRCLNCDIETVFDASLCVECKACVEACPTDCITFTQNGEEAELRTRLNAPAPNLDQTLYVSGELDSGRVMIKDENICLHCGLCAERCPTSAWTMQKAFIEMCRAGQNSWPNFQAASPPSAAGAVLP